jgi:hypothetical protein
MPEPTRTSAWRDAFGAVKSFMLKAINSEMSFNDFYSVAQDTGISYRRERMLTDWRSVQGLYKFESSITALDPNAIIPSRFVTDEMHSVNYNYLAGVEYKYTDAVTGETITGMRMVDSDELLSKADYLNTAIDLFGEGKPYADPSAREFKLRFVMSRREE